jgi:outer membrane protein assembly factor BamE (lipoprotein component of BamABCDE complex)
VKIPGWKRVIVGLFGTALALIGASGCAFSRGDLGVPLAETDVSEIKKGQTTEAQVVALLGAPQSVQEIDNREVFHYYHYALKHGTFLVFSRVNVASDDLYVFFNHDEIAEQVVLGKRTDKLEFQFWPFGDTAGE